MLTPNVVNQLSSAINGLNLQQAQLVLSTRTLTQEQMNQVLVQAGLKASEDQIQAELVQSALAQSGLAAEKQKAIMGSLGLMDTETLEIFSTKSCTKEKLLNMLATKGVTGAKAEEIITTLGLSDANTGEAVSLGLLSAATWDQVKAQIALIASNPMTWVIVATAAIYGFSKAYQALNESGEKAAEALKNAKSVSDSYKNSINDVISSQNDLASTANDIKQRYAELAQGIDSTSNKNISLSTEDYEEFLDLNSQLANLFPTLTKGYDENGNAILGLGGNIDNVTGKIQALIEQQKRLAQKETLDNLENYVNGDKDGGGQLEEIKRLEQKKKKADELVEKYKSFDDLLRGENVSSHDLGIADMEKIFKRANVDYTKLNMSENGWNISGLSETELNKLKATWHNYSAELVSEAQIAKDELTNANAEMSAEMMYWVQSLSQYADADNNMQAAIINMVNGINWSSLSVTDFDGAKNVIQQLVLTPFHDISSNPALEKQFSTAISGLFSLNINDMPAEQAKGIVANYIQQIMDILNQVRTDGDKLSLDDTYAMFGFSDFDNNTKAFSNNISKIAGTNSSDMKKLSNYTKEFTIAQQQSWLTATKGAKNAEEAINMYAEAMANKKYSTFPKAWQSLASDARNELLELARAGEISDTTLQSNKDYNTLLKDTGFSAKEARDEIMSMISVQEKMAGFQSKMGNIGTLYNEFRDKGFVTSETLEGLPDVFKEMNGGKDFDLFRQIVGDPTNGKEKIKDAFDDIVAAYLKDQNILAGTTNKTRDSVVANLKDTGVTNATLITSIDSPLFHHRIEPPETGQYHILARHPVSYKIYLY